MSFVFTSVSSDRLIRVLQHRPLLILFLAIAYTACLLTQVVADDGENSGLISTVTLPGPAYKVAPYHSSSPFNFVVVGATKDNPGGIAVINMKDPVHPVVRSFAQLGEVQDIVSAADGKSVIIEALESSPFLVEIQERLLCCFRQPLPPLVLPSLFSAGSLAARHV